MKRFFAFAFLFAAFLSCKDDLTKINNKNIIPKEEFVDILVGIHLIDMISNSPNFSRKYKPDDTVDINQSVFDKYHVTRAQFDTTVSAYIRQPEAYIKIYDEVLLKLNYMLDTLKNNTPQFSRETIEQ